jgi:hypothetical protein
MQVNVSFLPLLALLFIGLKLGGVITWSWWWVLAPLWIPALMIFALFFLAVLIEDKK